jgi:vacuolar protein sorting-associated protein 45
MDPTDTLDGIASIRTYIDRLITADNRAQGMKVLLLDSTTTQIVSCVSSQSEILGRQIYLVSRLGDNSSANNGMGHSLELKEESLTHMKAVVFIRPTQANIGLLIQELSQPRFSEYHIFFSGIVSPSLLNLLSESDEKERVKQVQEFYADFLPINEDLWSLNCRNTLKMDTTGQSQQHSMLYQRNLMGLQSMILAMKRRPYAIRFQNSSKVAKKLAGDIHESISNDDIFHFRRGNGGSTGNFLLLIVDRLDDPVTPLLSQWTYQAMVHELLGLNNSRVILRGAPNVSKDLEEVVLSSAPGHDAFFASHRNSNFGELGEAIQKLLQEYQARTKEHSAGNLRSIEDMQNFMDKYPELRSQSHTVSKHVAIMGELARLVEVCSLMDVSAFEQDLACSEDQAGHLRQLMTKLDSSSIKIPDKLRLGMLYCLRYENASPNNAISAVKEAMKRGGVPPSNVHLIDAVLRYAGASARGPGLYGTNKDTASKLMKSFMTSVQGVSNVYSQHSPVLMDTIEAAVKGKLKGDTHPLITGSGGRTSSFVENLALPQEVLIFMVGGMTYEEATKVNEFNQANSGRIRIVLGGSTVHNSTSFLEELKSI